MEERKYKELRMSLDDDDKLASEATIKGKKIVPPDGYLIGKITQVDNGMLIEYVEKKPVYPKTYEDCCKVLNIIPNNKLVFSNPNEESEYAYRNLALYNDLDKLKVCRDAYWKIAGDWKPDWTDEELNDMYYISFDGNTISKENGFPCCNIMLIFPTEEIRDAFYENFKELIEECKELL